MHSRKTSTVPFSCPARLPAWPPPRLWPAAALPPLAGLYCLVRGEWRAYGDKDRDAPPWPAWTGGLLLGVLSVLFLLGLWL